MPERRNLSQRSWRHRSARTLGEHTSLQPAHHGINSGGIGRRHTYSIKPFHGVCIDDFHGQAAVDTSVGKWVGDGKKDKKGVHGNEATQSPSQGDARRLFVR
jgi:hypothetical protein